MISRTHARRIPTLVARSLSTETATSSGPQPPPPPPPSQTKHSTAKPLSRTRLNPAPRPAVSHRHQVLASLPPSFGRNQFLPVADSTRALLESIVAKFEAPIRYAFAYGSGVFEQDGYTTSNPASKDGPMLDFLFAVTHADHWHSINMHQFPGHYPLGARMLGSSFVAKVEDIPPGVWFNSMVQMNGVTIKYGVTTVDNLCSDLLNWKSLYLSGRMHKPIRIIKDDARVRLTQQVNLTSAVRTALLTLPEGFSETELFERIAGFSYGGDVRMVLPAENRGKVGNIVRKQAPQFKELYHRLVVALPGVHWPAHSSTIQQDTSPHARAAHLRKLPSNLLKGVTGHYASQSSIPPKEADEAVYWTKLAGDPALPTVIEKELHRIVRYPSAIQTLKGLVSAGPVKSMRYSAEKVTKWWKGSGTGSGSSTGSSTSSSSSSSSKP
ncbi:Mmp37-domain-containing protein [Cubamyces sp. BRFM 1775]|nr:Mmp37-domain-containing protein [Cubamyces sp. BRFM 1775]